MTRWNKSGSEEPVIQIEYSKPGVSGIGCGLFLNCDGEFSIYYSNQNDSAVEVLFPVVNKTEPVSVDDDEGVLGGAVGDALPGFGLMAGMAALAMAAVAGSRVKKNE
jgi:outer membrane lipoprotein SlyB